MTKNADYRSTNNQYWQSQYETTYPDTSLVKLYHHTLKHELTLTPDSRILDYGCSNGSNAFFFSDLGFKAFGVDVNKIAIEKAIAAAAKRKSDAQFAAIPFELSSDDAFFGGNFDLILSRIPLSYDGYFTLWNLRSLAGLALRINEGSTEYH